MPEYDAVVVGAGPNGLAAAITLARGGWSVCVLEAEPEVGGAARSAELTRPGFVHDMGSSIHPLAAASPFFRGLPLERYGLAWVQPDLPLAHPLDGGDAAVMHRSLDRTARALGADAAAYRRLLEPLTERWQPLLDEILQPVLHVPRSPLLLAQFGLRAVWPAQLVATTLFRDAPARALWAGIAAHAALPLTAPVSAAIGLMLSVLGHAVGWPFPRGGAGQIPRAMAAYLEDLGGDIVTDHLVESVDAVPSARAVLLDVTPRQLLHLAGHRLPPRYRRSLQRYRYGTGAFKVDFALRAPIPWAAAPCRRAGTIHVGGTLEEVAAAERAAADGHPPERPFVLVAQHSRFDPTRAPDGHHTAWAYGHVPNGSNADMTERIERQIERFAPGFRDTILERHVMAPRALEAWNPNLVGGDVNGGAFTLRQIVARPALRLNPYRVPARTPRGASLFMCSASTPPGGGVHGMCGANAARAVLASRVYPEKPL